MASFTTSARTVAVAAPAHAHARRLPPLPSLAGGHRASSSFSSSRISRTTIVARAGGLDTNIFVNLLASGVGGAVATAVTTYTAEDTEKEIARIQTQEGYLPLAAALAGDAVLHSIPGFNVLYQLLAEPLGAACGVSYMMLLLLSSVAVDPNTLAPKGTVVNAEKAQDNRSLVRVPFAAIIPTAIKVKKRKKKTILLPLEPLEPLEPREPLEPLTLTLTP